MNADEFTANLQKMLASTVSKCDSMARCDSRCSPPASLAGRVPATQPAANATIADPLSAAQSELREIADLWPSLPPSVRKGIQIIVRSCGRGCGSDESMN
jgi:hypothetical protein